MFNLIHERLIFPRRIRALSRLISNAVHLNATILDVGCGSGELSHVVMQERQDLKISGLEVQVRPHTLIPVAGYDGQSLPYEDKSFDVVMFIDVLHHTNNAFQILAEAKRVSRKQVVIKDHLCEDVCDLKILQFMDRVGNDRFEVASPGNYWSRKGWDSCLSELDLKVISFDRELKLYPFPLNIVFGRGLHFFAVLEVPNS